MRGIAYMKIIDITRELFSAVVFQDDPSPEAKRIMSISNDAVCNLTAVSMCVHNATHIDAPFHFIDSGYGVDAIDLEKCYGKALVVECNDDSIDSGFITSKVPIGVKRLLVKGRATFTADGAEESVKRGMVLVGVENQSVAVAHDCQSAHKVLLESEVVILEGLKLDAVGEGEYTLCAFPLKMRDLDGSPCRAVLIQE